MSASDPSEAPETPVEGSERPGAGNPRVGAWASYERLLAALPAVRAEEETVERDLQAERAEEARAAEEHRRELLRAAHGGEIPEPAPLEPGVRRLYTPGTGVVLTSLPDLPGEALELNVRLGDIVARSAVETADGSAIIGPSTRRLRRVMRWVEEDR